MRTIIVFILFIIISFTGFSQEELTLDDAIEIAMHKNSSLQKSVNGLEGFESIRTSILWKFPSNLRRWG